MKNSSRILVIMLLALSVVLPSCNKDNNQNNGGTGTITCKIDGVDYTFNVGNVIFNDGTLNVGDISVALVQVQNASVGTFTVGLGGATMSFNTNAGEVIGAFSGTIEITQLSGSSASGTFSGQCRDVTDILQTGPVFTITDGTFTANF